MNLRRRDMARLALAAAATAALRPGLALAGPAAHADPLWYINAELRPFVRRILPLIDSFPKLVPGNLAAVRKGVIPPAPPLATVPWEKRAIPGSPGQPEVTVYVINAKAGAARGGILHTHGGGYVAGSVVGDLAWLQELAATLDCGIVSVDYRLAPETTWRGSLEDNYAGLKWLHGNGPALGIDPARIAVMGESAGGGHAALLALAARDRGEVPVAFQCLTYPMLDDRTGSSRAVPYPIGAFGWKVPDNQFGWRAFLGMKPGGRDVPAAAVPARRTDLAGLPPAWIGVGSIDLFVSEDIAYARALIEAGVPVESHVAPGAFHGFDRFVTDTAIARDFNLARVRALATALKA
ncbi:alpha/beta hydrolase [Novosphingobium bradum]|uniref:Alpha/beta hydrolase n=1 Tax=Novosphingobium bradum TaxID=1737444 RepID=A0ABV7ILL3_9SPHN